MIDRNFLIFGAFSLWLLVLTGFNFWSFIHYKKFTAGTEEKNIFSILEKILADLKLETEKTAQLIRKVKEIEADDVSHVQKVGLIRFNPFAETGGDQSFCLALLDAHDSGLVISSLHSRGSTRIYAKPVKEGKEVGYAFSEEEKKAIKGAKKIK